MDSEIICFLCSTRSPDVSFPLQRLELPVSRRHAMKLLADILGNPYIIACEAEDVVCRACSVLLSRFDYLEREMIVAKKNILRFLEKKCQVAEGSFLEGTQTVDEPLAKKAKLPEQSSQFEEKKGDISDDSSDPRSSIWMKCNSCEYTCNYKKFVERHVALADCCKCGVPLVNGSCPARCSEDRVVAPAAIATVANTGEQHAYLVPQAEIEGEEVDPRKAIYFRILGSGPVIPTQGVAEEIPIWDVPAEAFGNVPT